MLININVIKVTAIIANNDSLETDSVKKNLKMLHSVEENDSATTVQ